MRQLEICQGELTLVMDTQGPRKGPTLLFLHAGGETRSVWNPLFSRLRPKHWQLIAPDLRGHGESTGASEYLFDDYVNDAFQVIRHLTGRPLVVVGNAIGGLVALMLAQRYPKMIDGLVLLNAPTRLGMAAAERERSNMLEALRQQAALFPQLNPEKAATQLVEDIMSDPQRLARAARSVCVPTLFMHASKSPVVGDEELLALRQDIPHVEVEQVKAGQMMVQDNPQAIANAIARFVPELIPEIIH